MAKSAVRIVGDWMEPSALRIVLNAADGYGYFKITNANDEVIVESKHYASVDMAKQALVDFIVALKMDDFESFDLTPKMSVVEAFDSVNKC